MGATSHSEPAPTSPARFAEENPDPCRGGHMRKILLVAAGLVLLQAFQSLELCFLGCGSLVTERHPEKMQVYEDFDQILIRRLSLRDATQSKLRRCSVDDPTHMIDGSWKRVDPNEGTRPGATHYVLPWHKCTDFASCLESISWLRYEKWCFMVAEVEYGMTTGGPRGFPVFEPSSCALDSLAENWVTALSNRIVVVAGDSVSEGMFRAAGALLLQVYGDEVEFVRSKTACHSEVPGQAPTNHTFLKRVAPQYCLVIRRLNVYLCMLPARALLMDVNLDSPGVYQYLLDDKILTKDDPVLMNNAMVYQVGDTDSKLADKMRKLAEKYDAAGGSGPTVFWRETSPQAFVNGTYPAHKRAAKGACCAVNERMDPELQWAAPAEAALADETLGRRVRVIRTYGASFKLQWEGGKTQCRTGEVVDGCPPCDKLIRPDYVDFSNATFVASMKETVDGGQCLSPDGTHYFTSSPAHYHWLRVFVHAIRDLPPPDPQRKAADAFEEFWASMQACKVELYGTRHKRPMRKSAVVAGEREYGTPPFNGNPCGLRS
ncbi:hypothetical protein DIPPA_18180 [Diplonema papillatum]|nr:hypothetical protein DIPPA_18180 [Diplonema papillatum]|eukprot:gene657-1007_t